MPSPDLIVRTTEPFNAETPPDRLIASFITPTRDFFIRGHGAIPYLPADHRIEVVGRETRAWSADELRRDFTARAVTAALQCAGNRRTHLQSVKPTSGNGWDVGAIGNARWMGVALADLLAVVGVPPSARYVHVRSADEVSAEGETGPYEISIALAKAMSPDVLVAWAMNDAPLTPEHGAPLRLVTPGFAGARSPKWLTRIALADAPASGPMQARDYKLFPASIAREEADWDRGLPIDELPVNAAICAPVDGARVAAGTCEVRGYATASGRAIARVEVSADCGENWLQAEIIAGVDELWSWKQWRAKVELPAGQRTLIVRAVDAAGQMQPARPEDIWNFAGYLSTAWHRITVTAV